MLGLAMRVIVVAVVVLGLASAVRADPRDEPAKSVATAMAWSIGVTAVGVAAGIDAAVARDPGQQSAMFAFGSLGVLVGPSIGRIYAHRPWSAGLAIRALGFTGVVMGEVIAQLPQQRPRFQDTSPSPVQMTGLVYAMAGVMALGALMDLASTPSAVDDYNHSIAIVPTGTGLAVAGSF
jgi:hypothetical protein